MVNAKRAEKLLVKLVKTNSENPPGDMRKIADIIRKEMKSAGMDVRVYEFKKNMPNVVGTLKGSGKGKTLLLTPHMDTVPAGKGWKHDPFGAEIKNGKIYGRGAEDCKINVAACLEIARSISESGVKLNGNLVIAVTPDEETGSKFGIKPLIERGIIKPDYAIVADGDSFEISISQKGLVQIKVEIFGRKAHGAYPWLGVNAIDKASEIICELKKYKFVFRKHPLLREPTINIGTIYGGEKVNIVADYCFFEIDLRYLPRMNANKILGDFRKIISKKASRFKISISDHQKPYETKGNDPVAQQLLKSLKKFKSSAAFRGTEGAAAISFFRNHNAVATGFGPKDVAHMTDEYSRISDFVSGARALEDFIREYLKYR